MGNEEGEGDEGKEGEEERAEGKQKIEERNEKKDRKDNKNYKTTLTHPRLIVHLGAGARRENCREHNSVRHQKHHKQRKECQHIGRHVLQND